mgnify:CR=1 FL=1
MKMPMPKIIVRGIDEKILDEAIEMGAHPISAHILAGRYSSKPESTTLDGILNPDFKNIPRIKNLKDIEKASKIIADAISNNENIGLLCDFDVDGVSSAAILYKAMNDYFKAENVHIYISNRMEEGYGFSEKLLHRVMDRDEPETLLITADMGSADQDRIKLYKEMMKERKLEGRVVVTDHHGIPSNGGPVDADAFVNPQQDDDEFGDGTICGATVALLVMAGVRAELIEQGVIEENTPGMKELMAYSTAATISDCVSMASGVNRAIVVNGLKEINAGKLPAWRQMRRFVGDEIEPIRTDSIGFGLGPRINACSRIGMDGLTGVKYYLSETDEEAKHYFDMLSSHNEARKDIEGKLVKEAMAKARALVNKGHLSLVIDLGAGHHGVHGIVASRIVEKFGRPTICISHKDHEGTILSGSARSIELWDDKGFKSEFNIRQCLQETHDAYEDGVFLGFGGHKMAAGMSLKAENLNKLIEGFEYAVAQKLAPEDVGPVVLCDGKIPEGHFINLDLLDELLTLEPYGRGFEYPSFMVEGTLNKMSIIGPKKETGKLLIDIQGRTFDAMWFKLTNHAAYPTLKEGKTYKFITEIRDNFWKNNRTISLFILHAEEKIT